MKTAPIPTKKYKFHYVPSCLLAQWSEDGERVSWSNPFVQRYAENVEIESVYRTCLSSPNEDFFRNIEDRDNLFRGELEKLMRGDFDFLYDEDNTGRANLLFLLMRTDRWFNFNITDEDARTLIQLTQLSDKKTLTAKVNSSMAVLQLRFLLCRFRDTYNDELQLLRFEPVLLRSPVDSSFIVGPSPMNVINPFFSGRHPRYEDGNSYDLIGTCLMLPLSPSLSFCLYDKNIYRFRKKNGVCSLTSHDVDILNMIQIYNGGKDSGFIYTGDKGRIVDTILRFGGLGVREKRGNFDQYPFETDLSCCFVRAEKEEKFSSIHDKPVEKYVSDLKKYNEGFIDRISTDLTKYSEEKHRRFVYAHNCLFEDQIEE